MGEAMRLLEEFQPHVTDASRRLRRIAIIFIIALISGFFLAAPIVRLVIDALDLTDVTIVVTSPFQLFNLSVNISFLFALSLTVPYAIWNLYTFLRPGLTRREYRALFGVIPMSLSLFILGSGFGAISMYWGLSFMAKQAAAFGIDNYWDVGTFISQMVTTSALLGVLFQFPIILGLLMKFGIVNARWLEAKRPIVYATTMILVAMLPPSDGVTLVMMTVPLIVLYELTLLVYRGQ